MILLRPDVGSEPEKVVNNSLYNASDIGVGGVYMIDISLEVYLEVGLYSIRMRLAVRLLVLVVRPLSLADKMEALSVVIKKSFSLEEPKTPDGSVVILILLLKK